VLLLTEPRAAGSAALWRWLLLAGYHRTVLLAGTPL